MNVVAKIPGKKFKIDSLKFEMLLSAISVKFISVPADRVDDEIRESLFQICNFRGFDISAVWQLSRDNPDEAVLTHYYRSMEGPEILRKLLGSKAFPWTLKRLFIKEYDTLVSGRHNNFTLN